MCWVYGVPGEKEERRRIAIPFSVFYCPFAHANLFINSLRIWNPTQLLSDIVKPYVRISIEDSRKHNLTFINTNVCFLLQISSITTMYTYFYENYGDSMSTLERLLTTPSTRKCIEVCQPSSPQETRDSIPTICCISP